MSDVTDMIDSFFNGLDKKPAKSKDEIQILKEALVESVKLQSHYAGLLNDYDGGKRIVFKNAREWLERLESLKGKKK